MQPVDAKKCGYAVLAVALCLMVFAGEYFVYYSDTFEYDADVRWEDGSINYEIGSSGSDVYDVVLFDRNGGVSVSNLAIFVDETYSTHYDEASELASISHNDQDYFATQILLALDNRGFDGGFKCDSDGLYEFMITTLDDPRGCGVLVTSYSLPASVYAGSEDDLLIRWVSAGGTLYWTGSEVGGFCTDDEYREFMRETPEFERNLVRSGIYLIKFWFSVSREEQKRRFREREVSPLKRWKLSPIDKAAIDKWDAYTRAKEAMFYATDTLEVPWVVVKSDDKKRARLNAMRYVLRAIPYDNRDLDAVGPVDPLIVGRAGSMFETAENLGSLGRVDASQVRAAALLDAKFGFNHKRK